METESWRSYSLVWLPAPASAATATDDDGDDDPLGFRRRVLLLTIGPLPSNAAPECTLDATNVFLRLAANPPDSRSAAPIHADTEFDINAAASAGGEEEQDDERGEGSKSSTRVTQERRLRVRLPCEMDMAGPCEARWSRRSRRLRIRLRPVLLADVATVPK
eukprot:COSAG05_NODE_180_length_14817_cov_423.925262_18_plen_162_part_00